MNDKSQFVAADQQIPDRIMQGFLEQSGIIVKKMIVSTRRSAETFWSSKR